MAMAHSVEGRFPFLDHRVVEMAARIPPRLKLHGLTEKYVLRQAARDLLPHAHGGAGEAALPRARQRLVLWRRRARLCRRARSPARRIAEAGVFDRGAVEKLARKGRAGRVNGFRDNAALGGNSVHTGVA